MMAQLMGLPVISPERLKDLVDGKRVTVIDVNSGTVLHGIARRG